MGLQESGGGCQESINFAVPACHWLAGAVSSGSHTSNLQPAPHGRRVLLGGGQHVLLLQPVPIGAALLQPAGSWGAPQNSMCFYPFLQPPCTAEQC